VSAAADGTAALPGIAFANNLNTGIYRPGADQLAISTNGTGRLFVNNIGNVGIGTATPGSALEINAAASTSPFIAKINTSEVARIDSSSRLLVGTSSVIQTGTSNHKLQVSTESTGGLSIISNTANAANPVLAFAKQRSGTTGGTTIVSDNDGLGRFEFYGADGTDLNTPAAYIECRVDGTPGANDMPGRLVFFTTADGASIPTERMRIKSTGAIRCVTAFTVVTLPAGEVGDLARVTDANAPSVGSPVASGGAANALCWYNGTNWTVIGV
jgi:hypothetical protein